MGGNERVLRQVVDIFLVDEKNAREQIADAIAEGNSAEVRRNAHSLKSTLGLMTAQKACDLALRLETIGNGGRLDEAEGVFRELDKEMQRLRPELEAYLRRDLTTTEVP
jgi:HPt (histidine-containing phosphotransfer) domain-containing protein